MGACSAPRHGAVRISPPTPPRLMPNPLTLRVGPARGLFWPLFCALALAAPAFAQTGTLAGTVVDADFGDPLIGVNVVVEDLGTTGAATDLDGRYRIPAVPTGTYTLAFSAIGFQTQRVTGVEVADGEVTTIDLQMGEDTELLGEVVVEARVVRNNEAALLAQRARAIAVSDAISAEAISRSGAGNAADAMAKVPGASVVGGKYVVVRGLSDRYLNTQLNGATLPSADPDRNASPLDLFPSGLLDNITTNKTFTADKPGDFTGGSVNLQTRSFPEQLTAQISTSIGFNSEASVGETLIFTEGLNALGGSSADLTLPNELQRVTASEIDFADDATRAALTNSLAPNILPRSSEVAPNYGLSVSVGNRTEFASRPIGFVFGVNYDRSTSGFTGGVLNEYDGARNGEDVSISPIYRVGTRAGTEEVSLGGLANITYQPTDRSEVGLNLLYNRNGEAEAFFAEGDYLDGTLQTASSTYRGRSLQYVERTLASAQLRGDHALSTRGHRIEWNATASRTTQEEPDYRVFESEYEASATDTTYRINTSAFNDPRRFFRDLEESGYNGKLDFSFPLGSVSGQPVKLKVGTYGNYRDRAFSERSFNYSVAGRPLLFNQAGGNPDVLLSPEFTSANRLFISEDTDPSAPYGADMVVGAGYAMADFQALKRLRMVVGARLEYTNLSVVPALPDATYDDAGYSTVTPLGSLGLIYALSDGMNLRTSYGKTLARPTFREVAPYAAFELRTDRTFIGNPNLEQSDIHNADVRWEWFVRPGEILAVSAFYKRFLNPIENTQSAANLNDEFTPANLGDADMFGLELEARRRLDFLPSVLSNLEVGGNLSLTHTAVEVTESEQLQRGVGEDTRPLQGQSPYVGNFNLSYGDAERGSNVGLFYNVFGRRLFAVSRGLVPDLYEEPRHVLDLIVSQQLISGISAKFSAKNLLNEPYELSYELNDETFTVERYLLGRTFSFGVSYSL